MAEFKEVMKQKVRMCKTIRLCEKCPLGAFKGKKQTFCSNAMKEYPEEAEEIIMQWAEEHSVKTNADKFKEVFGVNVKISDCGCGLSLRCASTDCDKCENHGFWSREYIKPKED